MDRDTQVLLMAGAALLAIFVISTTLFIHFENRYFEENNITDDNNITKRYDPLDAGYWAVVTLATVGYGDISPQSPIGKIVSMFLIIIGLSIYVSVISRFGSFIIGRSIKEARGLGKCEYENHVVLLGMNDVLEEAARQLAHAEKDIAIIVEEGDDVDRASRLGAFPILGNPTDTASLEMANLARAKTVLINLEDDSKTILASLACRKISKSIRVVAVIRQRDLIELVKESGVESVLSPQALTGRMLASAVYEPDIIDFVDDVTSGITGADLREFESKEIKVAGSKVGDALYSLRQKTGVLLVGLVKIGQDTRKVFYPGDDEMIEENDRVILLGYPEQFEKLE
jgi:voltage-gated potassium channel